MPETLARSAPALILGTLAMRTRSIWGGPVMIHIGVATTMDVLALRGCPPIGSGHWWELTDPAAFGRKSRRLQGARDRGSSGLCARISRAHQLARPPAICPVVLHVKREIECRTSRMQTRACRGAWWGGPRWGGYGYGVRPGYYQAQGAARFLARRALRGAQWAATGRATATRRATATALRNDHDQRVATTRSPAHQRDPAIKDAISQV